MAESIIKLSKCEVCIAAEAKYTCPKCEVRTCSLPCVKIHKKELECDGIRDKVAFKPISQMTNLDLLSDYRLLEEAKRSVESYQKDETKRYSRFNKDLPIQLFRLGAAAHRRGIHILFLPQHFTRHKNNTTYLDWKTQIIHWRIEWIFPQADNVQFVNDKVFEGDRLAVPLDRFLDPSASEKPMRDRLQWYQSAGVTGVVLLLKAEHIPKSGLRYYQLDPSLTLQDNLRGKTIFEFPVIYVVLKAHKDTYDILTQDEEEEIEEAKQLRMSQPHGWNNKRTHSTTEQSRNLLFSEDSPDVEEAKRSKHEFDQESKDVVK